MKTISEVTHRQLDELSSCSGMLSEEQRLLFHSIRTLLNEAPVAMGFSRNGVGFFSNQKFLQIFGLKSIQEMVGRHVSEYFAPEFREESRERIRRRSLGLPVPSEFETVGFRSDGFRFPVRVEVAQVNLPDGKAEIGFVTDLTERKQIEAQLLRSQRMESLGVLAGGIAHDLNNILAPIVMSIEMLKPKAIDPHAKSLLDAIEVSAKRGAEIVRQVLTFSRGMAGELVEVQPEHLLKDLENIIKETFPRDIRLQFSVPKDTWTILGDPTQVHQILLNLCVNARDAMPCGGSLTILVENSMLDEIDVAMNRDAKAGRYVNISVTDSGTGIPPEILDKIFDPFFTTKEPGKGTGLGLSTVINIVKSHRGVVKVESRVSSGTTFNVYLPTVVPVAGQPKGKKQPVSLKQGKGETVLVVDDEASILIVTSQTLKTFGYRVLTAKDGAEAMAIYAQYRDKIDVVITDMMMPIMDGPATIKALRRINPRVRIMGASGLSGNYSDDELSELGLRYFLRKPHTAKELLEGLRSTLERD